MPNRLFWGDNLEVLRKHVKDATVDLCYIDPPFNSNRTYNQIYNNVGSDDLAQAQAFIDTWNWDDEARNGYQEIISNEGGRFSSQTIDLIRGLRHVLKESSLLAYLVSMTRRLVEIQRTLKPSGTFYLHCDPTSSHYLKLVCDGIFCGNGGDFLNEIIWKRTNARSTSGRWPRIHDVILCYSKSDRFVFSSLKVKADSAKMPHTLITGADGRKYQTYELTAPGETQDGESGRPWHGFDPGTYGRHWANNHAQMDAWDSAGLIHWAKAGKAGGFPRRRDSKPFEPLAREVIVGDVWTDIDRINQAAKERLGYPTQKPESLMDRIILASSREGDVVLDPFCGCGTTVAVAQRLRRQWIGVDITYQSIALVLRRLEDSFGAGVASSVVLDGAPRDVASARALAHKKDDRLRKEFEKWAVLTFTKNRAAINQKKGADAGIDGYAYVFTSRTETDRVVFQVKSGNVGRGDVAKLKGDMDREGAKVAVLLTLEEPTGPMKAEAKKAGFYDHAFTGTRYDRVQIATIREILQENKRFGLPLNAEVLKTSQPADDGSEQFNLLPDATRPAKMAKAKLPLGFSEAKARKPRRRA